MSNFRYTKNSHVCNFFFSRFPSVIHWTIVAVGAFGI
jgi:hypothetical protein